MFKRISCILTVLAVVLCLSSGSLVGVIAVADEETYLALPTSGALSTGTYKLTKDVTVSSKLQVPSNTEVTIDLNGYTISGNVDVLIYINGGTLNLIDSSEGKTGSIENTAGSSNYKYCAVKIGNSGTFNMDGGTLSAPRALYVYSTGCTANITSGIIEATIETAIYMDQGEVNISGSETVKVSATGTSNKLRYAIYCKSGTITITNPNTYVSLTSGSSSSTLVYNSGTKRFYAGYYTSDISSYLLDGYSCVASGNADYPYVVKSDTPEVDEGDEGDGDSGDGEEEEDSWLYGFSLRLDGAVGVNFYFDTAEMGALEEYYLVARIGEDGEKEEVCSYSEYTDYVEDETGNTYEVNCICYTVYVKPNQFSDMIYVYLTDGTSVTDTYEYSVDTYCLEAINENLEESDLCKALLNYGYYASVFEAGSGDNILEEVEGWVDPVTQEWAVDLSSYSGTTTDGVTKTLILGSSVVIRLYLTADVAGEDDVFTFEGNALEKHEITDEYYSYYIEFKVPARKMSEMLTVSKNGEEFTKYSVLSYVNNVINADEYDDALKNLCKAIYYYSVAADNYSGWI